MKRKLFLLTAILLSLSLFLTACKQGEIDEAKAKEIALNYVNNMFDANETQASVEQDQTEYYRDETGALVTSGDGNSSLERLYFVRVPEETSIIQYEVAILGSTGEVLYASRGTSSIRLTDAQKKQAEAFYVETSEWEDLHVSAMQSLRQACFDWAKTKLDESRPVVLDANRGEMPGVKQRQFGHSFYVVTRDGRVYSVSMQWPSMQVMSIEVIHAK